MPSQCTSDCGSARADLITVVNMNSSCLATELMHPIQTGGVVSRMRALPTLIALACGMAVRIGIGMMIPAHSSVHSFANMAVLQREDACNCKRDSIQIITSQLLFLCHVISEII